MTRLHLALALLVALGSGCGASTSSSGSAGTLPDGEQARLAELEEARRQQDEEIRALRSELAIARGEAEALRSAQSTTRVASITIRADAPSGVDGGSSSDFAGTHEADPGAAWIEPDAGEVVVDEPQRADRGPRPVLRVRGVPSAEQPTMAIPTPTLPPGAAPPGFAAADGPALAPLPRVEPLPVAPIPIAPGSGVPPSFAGVGAGVGAGAGAPLPATVAAGGAFVPVAPEPRAAEQADTAVVAYRAALAKLRDREYVQAVEAFDSFLASHPQHAYAANAQYWRAEAIYAQRRYRDALHAFEVFVQRHSRHAKVADALLKMGLCHARSGDAGRARVLFQRVQQEYPDTVAARIASREEAS